MLKLRAVLTAALVVSAPAFAASLLVVCADEASRNLKDDVSEIFSGTKTVVKMAGPKAPATACVSQTGVRRQECFAAAGGAANVESVLVISTAGKPTSLAVTFEVLSATDGKQQRREVLRTTAARFKAQAAPVLKRVTTGASGKRKPDAASKKPDPVAVAPSTMPTPAEPAVTPEPAPPLPTDRPVAAASVTSASLEPSPDVVASTTLTAAPPSSHAGAWVATSVAIAAAGAAGAFAGLGFSNQAQLMKTTNGVSPLTYSQAQAQQRTANLQLTVALGAAIAAGVSGGLAAFLWSRE